MLVCNVSLRPPRSAIAATIAETAAALDDLGSGSGQVVFATLVDDPASVGEIVDAYLGEIMLEAASADAIADASIPASYAAAIAEAATAAETQSASTAPTSATWDAATVAAVTLSGGNLVATNTGTTSTNQGAHVATASGKTTGKYYFECTITTFTNGAGVGVGVGTTAATYAGLSGSYSGGDLCLVVGHTGTGVITAPTGNSGFSLGALTSGDVICAAVNVTDSKVWFRKGASGPWMGPGSGTQDPTASPGLGGGIAVPAGTIVPFVTFGSGLAGAAGVSGNVITANFGASSFVGAVPSGYTAGWPA